jgi:hypothetical protein
MLTRDPTTMQSAHGFPHPVGCPQPFEQGAGDNSGFIHQVFPRRLQVTSSEPALVPNQIHMLKPCLPTGDISQSGDPAGLVAGLFNLGRSNLLATSVLLATIFSPGLTG